MAIYFLIWGVLVSGWVHADQPDWSEGFLVPPGGRSNPYQLSEESFQKSRAAGQVHAQVYPVTVTGMLPPYEPMKRFFEKSSFDPMRDLLRTLVVGVTGIRQFEDAFRWLGLHPYPLESEHGVYSVAYPQGVRPGHPMGFGVIERNGAKGFTVSCAGCHSANLFGKTVLGMTNRFPRANEAFLMGKTLAQLAEPHLFKAYNNATDEETDLLRVLRKNTPSIGVKKPLVLGLDTSLAQVAMSLARRSQDSYAGKSRWLEVFPRREPLSEFPADSKPAVWWNVKYKNRWLSDGSVISGNPILTNLLWNEIGRGADLRELDDWLRQNPSVVEELTTAVFSSEAPRFTDFFSAAGFPMQEAQRGESVYQLRCARCHGVYVKGWSLPNAHELSPEERLRTTQVIYPDKTFVRDVGTDPMRRLGMRSLLQLNELAISQNNGIEIREQAGYVPPPLVGIWARWPYLHNNSVPNLCALLTRPEERPRVYYAGEAVDPVRDFDADCNGYPLGDSVPVAWRKPQFRFDASRPGLGNGGHAEGIFLKDGRELLSPSEKRDLIRFLQTL